MCAWVKTVLCAQNSLLPHVSASSFRYLSSPMELLDSDLFKEWLGLAGGPSPTPDDPLGPDDALCVIDMQADFLPHDPERNPHGGRFGVAEGLDIIDTIVKLVDMAADSGATVCATRDYHPIDHVCFTSEGGPFPAHCV